MFVKRTTAAVAVLLWLFGARLFAAECSSFKIDWAAVVGQNPKTSSLLNVAGVGAVATGDVGGATLAFVPLMLSSSAGVETLLVYRISGTSCTKPDVRLLGTFKTETTLVRSYFKGGELHLITLKSQSERSMQHPADFLDTAYTLQDGKLVKVSSKEVKTANP